MAKNNGKYIVPEAERVEYDRLVQRANRRIKKNIQLAEGLKSDIARRSLTFDYENKDKWASDKTVFSRSKVFESEKEYKQYVRHLEQWGAPGEYSKSEQVLREQYYKSIVKALTTTAIDNGNGVLLKNGRLPGNLNAKIKALSTDQMLSFFDVGDPTEDIEKNGWDSWDYIGVDRDEFVDITEAHINKLKKLYPAPTDVKNEDGTYKLTPAKKKKPTKKKPAKKKKKKTKVKFSIKNRAVSSGRAGTVKHGKALQPPKNKTIKNFNQD